MRTKDRGLMEQIKAYVEEYALENQGDTPTIRDIGGRFGISHVSALRYLRAMDEIGMIRYDSGKIHTEVIDKIDFQPNLSAAYTDAIPAGSPDDLEGSIDEYVSIPSIFLGGKSGKHFILKVNGDSMVDAGIDSGDLVIVSERTDAKEGDIVVALVDNHGNTLKILRYDDEGAYLWAMNSSWSDKERMIGRNFEIKGIAVKVVKDIPNIADCL